jgi:APA family basic amino acid/polyamine antiporter
VVIAVFVIYAALPAVALSALPVTRTADGGYQTQLGLTQEQGGYAGDPILGVVKQLDLGFLQAPAEIYVGLLAATILFIATNAGIIGVSRLVYSMGLHRQMPDRLRRLHPKYGTPWVGILVFGFVACLAMLPGQADFLGYMYAFGAMLSFSIAHAAVIRLRITQPDRRRPYRGPGILRVHGYELPVFALVGVAGTVLAFIVVTILHLTVAVAGTAWLAIGVAFYTVYRHRQGLDLTTTTKVAIPRPVTEREAEYESVLLALDVKEYSEGAVNTAVKVAARRRRGIHVLVTIPVPPSSPITAEMPEQELAAQAIIEQARLQGGRRVSGHYEKVRPGQAGRMIVNQARAMRAQAVVIPLPSRTGGSVFGRTVETVLAERPCRVIIHSDGAGDGAAGRAPRPVVAGVRGGS